MRELLELAAVQALERIQNARGRDETGRVLGELEVGGAHGSEGVAVLPQHGHLFAKVERLEEHVNELVWHNAAHIPAELVHDEQLPLEQVLQADAVVRVVDEFGGGELVRGGEFGADEKADGAEQLQVVDLDLSEDAHESVEDVHGCGVHFVRALLLLADLEHPGGELGAHLGLDCGAEVVADHCVVLLQRQHGGERSGVEFIHFSF